MPILTFLEADKPLVKSYSRAADGTLIKESYPKVWEFTSHDVPVNTIDEFYEALRTAAANQWCLLKGNVLRPLRTESRAGSTDPNAPTWFACLDFDHLAQGVSVGQALEVLRLHNVDHIVQYSASHGIELERGETAHVFLMLDAPMLPADLKNWLTTLNLETSALTAQLSLTRSGNALSWPLDITTCQNDKLLYIAPPVLEAGVKCALSEQTRIVLVRGGAPAVAVTELVVPSAATCKRRATIHLNWLRKAAGLETRRFEYRTNDETGLSCLVRADEAQITGLKKERGYTYFNLNGGNSWGYYHPDDSPEVIRNFKGEPNYLTRDLLPKYWSDIVDLSPRDEKIEKNRQFLTFRDFRTAQYYNGWVDLTTGELELARASGIKQLNDYREINDLAKLVNIPDLRLIHDPQSLTRLDLEANTLNLFRPTAYMNQTQNLTFGMDRCPIIQRVLDSCVGKDPGLQEHLLNWIACMFVYRRSLGTSWALHGTFGTGKGVLINEVLVPLLGAENVSIKRMSELDDKFNVYLERSLLVVIDEAQISESRQSRTIMADLKNYITEPVITIRQMHAAAYQALNHTNWIFLSNQADPVNIEPGDRRFNVGEYGATKLEITSEEISRIRSELVAFASYLHNREADEDRARTVYLNQERRDMIAAGTNSIDTTANALREGNLEFFWEALPSGDIGSVKPEIQAMHDSYRRLLHDALRTENSVHRLSRDEVRLLFAFNVGDVPSSPAKFTRMMRLHRVVIEPMKIHGTTVRGMEIKWQAPNEWLKERLSELQANALPQKPLRIVSTPPVQNSSVPNESSAPTG